MESQIAYFEDYLDTVESLPFDVIRNFNQIREIDGNTQALIRSLKYRTKTFLLNAREMTLEERNKALKEIIADLQKAVEHGEEKVELATKTYEAVDSRVRRLDTDLDMFENTHPTLHARFPFDHPVSQFGALNSPSLANENSFREYRDNSGIDYLPDDSLPSRKNRKTGNGSVFAKPDSGLNSRDSLLNDDSTSRRNRKDRPRNNIPSKEAVKEAFNANSRKRQVQQEQQKPLVTSNTLAQPEEPPTNFDPNEPTYCTCNQVSYGEMIACDNADCEIEWFHLACMGLSKPPTGSWQCPNCAAKRGPRYRG